MKLLVTGGAGFIGSNFIRYFLDAHPDCSVLNLDKLTYAANLDNLSEVASRANYQFVQGDICDPELVGSLLRQDVEAVVHFAAETHVDRSIADARAFVETNVAGTYTLIEAARRKGVRRFLHVSTDEVYGSLGPGREADEQAPLQPSSPYAASKASSDLLVRSFCRTYGFPAVITRCSNNYGPYQFPEKLLPLMITNALEGKSFPSTATASTNATGSSWKTTAGRWTEYSTEVNPAKSTMSDWGSRLPTWRSCASCSGFWKSPTIRSSS